MTTDKLTALGMSAGPPPDRFLVSLAVLGLLSEVAADRPLLCLADDLQWIDLATAQVLAFVARRLGAESVGMVFGTRTPGGGVVGLPELKIGGLPRRHASAARCRAARPGRRQGARSDPSGDARQPAGAA
jgi:hypothetical protein